MTAAIDLCVTIFQKKSDNAYVLALAALLQSIWRYCDFHLHLIHDGTLTEENLLIDLAL